MGTFIKGCRSAPNVQFISHGAVIRINNCSILITDNGAEESSETVGLVWFFLVFRLLMKNRQMLAPVTCEESHGNL